jgi:23S rRNA (guanosine2251-2'-O)-methyltransferase
MRDLSGYQIRQCVREGCGLRYPLVSGHPYGERCPRCGASTRLIQSRSIEREPLQNNPRKNDLHLEALLDNIRSAWNVGSIFRTSDGLGICKLHLCGLTSTPENPKVLKTSLGAEGSVAWCQANDGVREAHALKAQGYHLWALEYAPGSESLLDITPLQTDQPYCLVVGNEVTGIDPGLLDLCERLVYIPMVGSKRSFNVAVAFGIAAYYIRDKFT